MTQLQKIPAQPAEKPLVLGSSSRYRKALLQRLQKPFSVALPDCVETPLAGESPLQLVRRLAEAKARSLASTYSHHLIIGSDQLAELDGAVLGKPGSVQAAEQQLSRLSGRSVLFRTALCLLDSARDSYELDVVDAEVRFRVLSQGEIRRYIALEKPLDCAGSIKSEGLGVSLFDAVISPDATALVGLPLIRLSQMLRNAGLTLP